MSSLFAIYYRQHCLRQSQQLTEAIKTKVDQISCYLHNLRETWKQQTLARTLRWRKTERKKLQLWRANFTHLKREFVLFFIAEGPDIAADILQVILHKSDHS